jgi:hypothetical protein
MAWRVVAGTALLHWNVVVVDDARVLLSSRHWTTYRLIQSVHEGSRLAIRYLRAYFYSYFCLIKTLYLISSKYLSACLTRVLVV